VIDRTEIDQASPIPQLHFASPSDELFNILAIRFPVLVFLTQRTTIPLESLPLAIALRILATQVAGRLIAELVGGFSLRGGRKSPLLM